MPYEPHPKLKTPPDGAVIWRYMSFEQFVDLLLTRSLYFARIDELKDTWEAAPPAAARREWEELGEKAERDLRAVTEQPAGPQSHPLYVIDTLKGRERQFAELTRESFRRMDESRTRFGLAVSCWHRSPRESEAFWRIYSARSCAVAIRSSVGRLKHALASSRPRVYVGDIRYADFRDDEPGSKSTLVRATRKRASFRFEREVRALINLDDPQGTSDVPPGQPTLPGGLIPVDLGRLISRVVVGPQTEPWVERVARNLCDRVGLGALSIERSHLYDPPPTWRAH